MSPTLKILSICAAIAMAAPAAAEEFQQIKDRDTFLSVVGGKQLTRFGIALDVKPTGEIEGRAFGTPVTGAWRWQDNYFCRDLFYGQRDLGPNCQAVLVNDDTVRFISDRGTGQSADLRLD